MKSLWSDSIAKEFTTDIQKRVYTSRLLGKNPELVLHGGGNTSVKTKEKDFFGTSTDIIYVKGSGWDLATIEEPGFAPIRMNALLKMAELNSLSDTEMVKQQRAAMLNPYAPNPSIEAIVHAIIPQKFVDHTHSNAIVCLTNQKNGLATIKEIYGSKVCIIPYVMPGFQLAKAINNALKDVDPLSLDGLILMNHGIFTMHDDAKKSYELMINLVSEAEDYINKKVSSSFSLPKSTSDEDLLSLSRIRKEISSIANSSIIVSFDQSDEAIGFSSRDDVESISSRGPLTPDHTIRTKRIPAILDSNFSEELNNFSKSYKDYFNSYKKNETMLTPDPKWAIWKNKGVIALGKTKKESTVVQDIITHTWKTIQLSEEAFMGGWQALDAKSLFEIEYWELEQAKLKKSSSTPIHEGKIAIVTGSAAGIGFACAKSLADQGANVIGIDLNPEIKDIMSSIGAIGLVANLTDSNKIKESINFCVREFGGIDILVSNAGIFTAGQYLENLDDENWDKSIAINLTSHQKLLKEAIPFLKNGIDPAIILVGSRNVNAPGAGAASYSCAKAGLTQLCRVASLELAPFGVRCNVIHPDAVFDTKLWTPENLKRSAERYNMTVEEYKTRNLMKTEIKSIDVGNMVSTMASSIFGKTTGAQIPIDGGNDRVI